MRLPTQRKNCRISVLLFQVFWSTLSVCSESSLQVVVADSVAGHPSCQMRSFRQKLDHFSSNVKVKGTEHFQQRYIICTEHWPDGGPLLFFTGSEADIMVFFNNTGFIFEMAAALNGLVVFAEHRYYGQSLPFDGLASSLNATTMTWLTVDNALADFKHLIDSLRENTTGLGNSSVITVGGSYSGMLAAWMRMRYPDTVTGALASSAPILKMGAHNASVPCFNENTAVTEVFRSVSPACPLAIHRAWSVLENGITADPKETWLKTSEIFRTCSDVTAKSLRHFTQWLSSAFVYMAMSNFPYPTNVFNHLPEWPVRAACSHLNFTDQAPSDWQLLMAVSKASSVYFNSSGQAGNCFDTSFSTIVNPDWPLTQWDYQRCRELLMPECSDGVHDMFYLFPWDEPGQLKFCRELTGLDYDATGILDKFGGDDLRNYTNIIFSNGKLDPWFSSGIRSSSQKEGITVIDIEDGAHHLDLRASHPNDPPSVTLARQLEIDIIQGWIRI